MTNTEFNIKFAQIWQNAETRQDAFERIRKSGLAPEMTYKAMISRVNYMRTKGVDLKALHRDTIDWSKVIASI